MPARPASAEQIVAIAEALELTESLSESDGFILTLALIGLFAHFSECSHFGILAKFAELPIITYVSFVLSSVQSLNQWPTPTGISKKKICIHLQKFMKNLHDFRVRTLWVFQNLLLSCP
jgi:hypothetical protein